jgi:hypothetical protein
MKILIAAILICYAMSPVMAATTQKPSFLRQKLDSTVKYIRSHRAEVTVFLGSTALMYLRLHDGLHLSKAAHVIWQQQRKNSKQATASYETFVREKRRDGLLSAAVGGAAVTWIYTSLRNRFSKQK